MALLKPSGILPSLEHLRALLECAPFGVLYLDREGLCRFSTTKSAEWLGCATDELQGRELRALLGPETFTPLEAVFALGYEGRTVTRRIELQPVPGNPLHLFLTVIPEPPAREGGIVAIITDVTAFQGVLQALRLSERRWKNMLDGAGDAIFLHDFNGVVRHANNEAARVLGYEPEEIRGSHISRFAVGQSLEKLHEIAKLLGDSGSLTTEQALLRKDGSTFPIEARVSVVPGPEGPEVLVVARDISERIEAQKALVESERNYRRIIEATSTVPWEYDLATRRITYVGPQIRKLLGYSEEDWKARKIWLSCIHPDDRARVAAHSKREARAGRDYELVYRAMTAQGRYVWVRDIVAFLRDEGGGTRLIGFMNDITEEYETALAVRESEAKLRATVNALPDILFEIDRTGLVLDYHASDTGELYLPPEVFLGRRLDEMISEEMWEAVRAAIGHAEREGRHFGTQYHLDMPGGRKWYEMSLSRKEGHEGESTRFIALVRDVTERKELEEQLRQAQKLEAVGTLAGGVAHDFNNLLQVIIGQTETLRSRAGSREHVESSLDVIGKAADRGASLVRGLLTFSRRTPVDFCPLHLSREVRNAVEMLRFTLPPKINVELALDDALPLVLADATQIHQILLNLGGNARDAMPQGGSLRIRTRFLRLSEEDCRDIANARPGEYVQLSVADTGTGIAPEVGAKMFEPFFTTKNVGEGSGLGLSIVYGIVQNHDGFLQWRSTPGMGTKFYLNFPVAPAQSRQAPQPQDAPPAAPGALAGRRILVVDDEEMIREMTQEMLASQGVEVRTAQDAQECLDVYRDEGPFELVLLDLGLPGMGGEECLGRLLQADPGARVVVATGYVFDDMAQKVRNLGAAGFLSKPYRNRDLFACLQEVLS